MAGQRMTRRLDPLTCLPGSPASENTRLYLNERRRAALAELAADQRRIQRALPPQESAAAF
jgi:hypothetical protein